MDLFYQPLLPSCNYLDANESRHCIRVLRHRVGDKITVADGKGTFYHCVITAADPERCAFTIEQQTPGSTSPGYIHIAVSPTKNSDRMEWFVEKAVEIGIDEISLVECEHSERTFLKTERLQKVAVSAMKQSLKSTLPIINPIVPLSDLLVQTTPCNRFIAYVDAANPVHLKDVTLNEKRTLVLIGPEGDFSSDELRLALQHGFSKVSLGKSRLRTETAALAACFILNLRSDS